MDTKKLRQKILDLAIHGKLVPQDPNDEPASVLLERIRAEKEQLIKEGKIKAPKKSKSAGDTSHYPKEVPFEVPEGWGWSTLGEYFNLQAGKFISAEDIHKESSHYPYRCFGGNGIRGYVSTYNRNGDFPIIGRQGALCGNINYASGEFYATEHAVVVESFGGTDSIWARYLLEQLNLNQYATATAQPGLSVKTINEVAIPIPPIGEQRRISDAITRCISIIKDIQSSCEELRTSVAQTKSNILNLAIHGRLVPQDPLDEPAIEILRRINPDFQPSHNLHYLDCLPNGWCPMTFGTVAEYINGRAFKPLEWEKDGLPIVRIQNLNDSLAEYNYTSGSFEEKYLIHHGDLLFAWAASLNAYVWSGDDAWLNQHIFKVIPKNCIIPKYLYYTLKAKIHDFYQRSHGSGMVHITRNTFLKETLLLPPIKEQERIIVAIEELYSTLDLLTACFTK